jgi:hypothetical protein
MVFLISGVLCTSRPELCFQDIASEDSCTHCLRRVRIFGKAGNGICNRMSVGKNAFIQGKGFCTVTGMSFDTIFAFRHNLVRQAEGGNAQVVVLAVFFLGKLAFRTLLEMLKPAVLFLFISHTVYLLYVKQHGNRMRVFLFMRFIERLRFSSKSVSQICTGW